MQALEVLFAFHIAIAAFCGVLALVAPHAYEVFFAGADDSDHLDGSLLHEVIQLYGALILGQAGIVYAALAHGSPKLRHGVCQAYCVIFSVTSVVLLKAVLAGSNFNAFAHVNVGLFGSLALAYLYFGFFASVGSHRRETNFKV